MPALGPSMSTHRHNPASSFRLPQTHVTWNGHRYLTMPDPVRIGPIKVNVIGYQSVRRDRPVKIHGRPEGMGGRRNISGTNGAQTSTMSEPISTFDLRNLLSTSI